MKFLEEHQLKMTALTPIHIGCGEDYTPTDYVIDDRALFAFGSAAVREALSGNARKKLLNLVSGNPPQDAIMSIQKLFYQHRDELIAGASHYLRVADGVVGLYKSKIGQAAAREQGGGNVANRLEIERAFYNPVTRMPVIPGSSLKGAIRTALLNSVLESGKNQSRPQRPERHKELEERLFRYKMKELEKDPMRLIHLTDSSSAGSGELTGEICFAVNHPRREPKSDGARHKSKGPYQLLETLPALNLRAYNSRLAIHDVGQLRQKGQSHNKLPAAELCWKIDQIAQACNDFYLPLLQKEMGIIRERRYMNPGPQERMDQFCKDIEPLLRSNKAMLLRVGRHSGAEAVTLNGEREIKIMTRRGQPPKYATEPNTLWLAADTQDSRSGMRPFGWLLVEIDPPDDPPPVLTKLAGQTSHDHQKWREKQRQRMENSRKALAQRRQQDKEKDQERQAEQKAEQERQAALDAMTGEQRAIEELKEWIEQDRAGNRLNNQGRVAQRLAELIKDAKDWPGDARLELCELAEPLYGKELKMKGSKGRKRKEDLRKLRE